MSWFDELIDDALKDPYLNELIIKAEKSYTAHFLDLHNIDSVELSEKEFSDLLRFADILCRSKDPSGRNKAYKIISCYMTTTAAIHFSKAVLILFSQN